MGSNKLSVLSCTGKAMRACPARVKYGRRPGCTSDEARCGVEALVDCRSARGNLFPETSTRMRAQLTKTVS